MNSAEKPLFHSVAILGLGLMGGSLGLALRNLEAEVRVTGWSRNPVTRSKALDMDAVDMAADTPEQAVENAEIIVLAVPVETILPLLERVRPSLTPNAIVTDVGSVKSRIVAGGEESIGGRFVGGHPMAGSEDSGIDSASVTLYHAAPWVFTPTAITDSDALDACCQMACMVGAKTYAFDPETHDRIVACYSHLPHILAYGLAQTAWDLAGEGATISAGSFRDGTRVAGSSPSLWTEILMDNRTATLRALESFDKWAHSMKIALTKGDQKEIEELLFNAHQAHREWKTTRS